MEVRDAVRIAKYYVQNLYMDEEIRNLGLEEVELDDDSGDWLITVGFSRKWEHRQSASAIDRMLNPPDLGRSYKTVRLKAASGEVLSVKDRILEAR